MKSDNQNLNADSAFSLQARSGAKTLLAGFLLIACLLALLCPMWPQDVKAQTVDDSLRLAWLDRTSLNPLETFDFSGQAAMKLVYRGLFMLDDAEMLRTDLAEEANWSPDHFALTIKLRKDASFSDRSPLTSRDAALSILYRRYYLQAKLQREAIPPEYLGTELEEQYDLPLPSPWDFLEMADPMEQTGDPDTLEEDLDQEEDQEEALAENLIGEDLGDQEEGAPEDQAGQIFTADLQASYLNQLASDPLGIQAYEAIKAIKIHDQYSFTIQLSQRAERLPWFLCFPLIPESYLESHDLTPVPGVGSYKFVKAQGEGSNWELHPVSARFGGLKLLLKSYPDFDSALADFNQDHLDLLLVPASDYLNLRHRQGLKAAVGESLDYYLLLAGSDPSFPLADPQLFRAFRQAQLLSRQDLAASSYLNLPHRASDWRQAYALSGGLGQTELPDLSEARRRLTDQTITLAAVSNSYNRSLLAEIKQMPLLSSSQLEVVWLQAEDLPAFAAAGRYDLLLLDVELSLPTDLRTLVYELNQLVPDLNLRLPDLAAEGLLPPAYFYAWDLETEDIPLQAIESSYQALSFALERSRVLGLGFAGQALLLGPRLACHLAAPAWDPYRYITEVTLCP